MNQQELAVFYLLDRFLNMHHKSVQSLLLIEITKKMEITSSNLISIYEPISKNTEFNKILLEHLSSLGLLDGISLLILNTP